MTDFYVNTDPPESALIEAILCLGLDAGQTVGVVAGVFLGLLLLLIVGVLLGLRYKPEAVPKRVTSAIPESVQRRVKQNGTEDDARVNFSNPLFGEYGAPTNANITLGSKDTNLQTFAES